MDDDEIYARIKVLVDEERALGSDADQAGRHQRRLYLEQQLDQCWDLLRQRQARREFDQDPGAAKTRPAGEVEGYLQ